MNTRNEQLEYLIHLAEEEVYDGNYEKGRELLFTGLLEEPGYARLHERMAWIFEAYQENDDLAVRHYELSIYFDAENANAYYALVDLYWEKRDVEQLRRLLIKAKAVEKINKDYVYAWLGTIAERENAWSTAIQYYREAMMHAIDNGTTNTLRQNIRRCRFKRLRGRRRHKMDN